MSKAAWARLRKKVIHCQRCPRLRSHCLQVADVKRKAYLEQTYWGRPVPNFGMPPANLLVVGLAPGAHGANRTGRMFTGDRSGEWLYRAMFKAGFANQAKAENRRDGLQLIDAIVTNVGRCAPPDNRPTSEELGRCREYFQATLRLTQPRVIIALGGLAWNQTLSAMIESGFYPKPKRRPKFAHGAEERLTEKMELLGCYHPSQQNTFTGRLTEPMIDAVFRRARTLVSG